MARNPLYLTPGEPGYIAPGTRLPNGDIALTPPLRNPKGSFSRQVNNPDAGGVGGGVGGLTGQGGAGADLNLLGVHAGGSTNLDPVPGGPTVSFGFSSVTDFLNFIGWIVHPLNWLRLAEFILGILLSAGGVAMLTRRRGGTTGNVARRIVSVTPAGRTIRRVQGGLMGRHEGQREAARMEARQRETREVRERSAIEREQINRNARQSARETT